MKSELSRSAVHPATAAPWISRRPYACPTRTAAAELIPSGTMYVVEITLTAMPWAASDASSSRAAIVVTTANTAPSNSTWPAAGRPSWMSRRMRARSGLQEIWNRRLPPRRSCQTTMAASTAAMYARDRDVESADPATPIFGAPQWPYISSQLPPAFTMLALTSAKVTGLTTFIDCK